MSSPGFTFIQKPDAIYERSFQIIRSELAQTGYVFPDELTWAVIQRVIHSTADFDFVSNLRFHAQALQTLLQAFKSGSPIVTDARMVQAGLNRTALKTLGISTYCYIDDPEAQAQAKIQGITVSMMAMQLAAQKHTGQNPVFAIGNAPTALFELINIVKAGGLQPAAIVGMPVGFVSVVESKEALMELETPPWITSIGRKGGSSATVGALNALLLIAASN